MLPKLELVYLDLRSDKATKRKDAIKQLLAMLDSPKYLQGLDEATAALPPDAPVPALSWPGLAHVVARAVGDEVRATATRKKGPDATLQRVFRLMVARAEEGERRCGHARLLLRRAGALLRHVADVLEAAGPTSGIGLEYSAVLRNHLLTVPEYCASTSATTFQALLEVHMDFLEQQGQQEGGRGGEEASRTLATMAALLAAFPGDMQPLFQADCLLFFNQMADRVGQLAADGNPGTASRLLTPTLAALNAFLLANGRDVAAQLPALHAGYHPHVLEASGRDVRLREAAVAYLRLQLQLGTPPRGSRELADVLDWVERQLGRQGFKWGEDSREGRLLLGRPQTALLDLAAAAHLHASGAGAGEAPAPAAADLGPDDFEHSPLPAPKRRRTAPLLSGLAERVAGRPAVWAPVLARLLLGYGLVLPLGAHADWLAQLAGAAPAHFPGHFMPDEHDADAALWMLRLAHAAALAWPAQLTPGGGRDGDAGCGQGGAQAELPPQDVIDEQWMAVWECVLGYAKAPNVHPASLAAALAVLAAIAQRRLVQLPPGFHRLWGLPLLQQVPTPAGLQFLAAAAQSGRDTAVDATTWQPAFLQWLRAAAAAEAPGSLVTAFAAVLRLPDEGGAGGSWADGDGSTADGDGDDAPSLARLPPGGDPWWRWWQQDAALSAQLARLVRGELLMRARALALLDARRRAAAAARPGRQQLQAVLAPAQLQDQAAEVLEERLEDVARQAPSPGPPTTLHALQDTRLAQLLSAAAVAVSLATRAAAASRAAGLDVPACWLPAGRLAAKLALALEACGRLLAESCKRVEGLHPGEEERLRALVAALHAHVRHSGSHELADSLLQCMGGVQELFLDASSAVGAVVRATQAAAATRGMAAATDAMGRDFFDDDLDVGGRAAPAGRAGSAGPATAAVSTSASLAAACKTRCAALLALLGPLRPANGCAAAQHWLDKSWEPGKAGLPEEAHLALIDALVQCAVHAMPHDPAAAATYGLAACKRLSAASHGLLSWLPRHHNGRCLFTVRRVRRLTAAAAAAPASAAAATLQPLLGELVQVADDCFLNITEAEEKADGQKLTGWPLRVALAEALVALFAHDHRLLPPETLEAALGFVQGLLSDDSYDARLAGSRLVQVLFAKFTGTQALFTGLLQHLSLESSAVRAQDNVEQHVETSLLMLGETAAGCAGVELQCLFLLCGHVAAQGHDLPLVAATLDWLAARLGYPHRHAYAAWHQRGLLYHWFAAGWGLTHWRTVQPLVAPTPEAAVADARGFLGSCAAVLAAMLVWGQQEEELRSLAATLGIEPAALVERHFEVLMGMVYPYSLTGRAEEREMAVQKLSGPMMRALLPAAEVNRLIRQRLVECAAQLLLMARGSSAEEGEPDPPRPWFRGHLLVRAVASLADTGGDAAAQLGQLLSGDNLAGMVLAIHGHLELAHHPRHQLQALAPLQAMLSLLGDRVCEGATLRYAGTILIRLLPVRAVQARCCAMLSGIVARVLSLATAAELAQLGALLPALLSTLAEAIEAEHSAGRPLNAPAAAAMLGLVRQLTAEAPPGLQPHLRQVDPLPASIPALQQAAAAVAAARRDITPWQQLLQFAGRASSMTPALRHRSLAALRHLLITQQQELFSAPQHRGTASGAPAPASTTCLPGVASAAWQLAVLSSDLADAELAQFAGELLALAGPLDPAAIAFDPAAAHSHALPADSAPMPSISGMAGGSSGRSQSTQTPGGGSRAGRGGGRLRASPGAAGGGGSGSTWVAALQLLGDYLVDEQVGVISAAQHTLRRLLATPEGQQALPLCDPALRPHLEAFRHDSAGFARPASPPDGGDGSSTGGQGPQLGDTRLWRCDGRPFGEWVCSLAGALLREAGSATLSICRHMAQLKPAFAELLLPHAFADLAEQATGGATAVELGGLISRELLPRLHRHPKAARLLLSCLNHLRSQYLDAKLAGSSAAAAGSKGAAGKAQSGVELWGRVYWVDVSYLDLAAAAARCGAHFTALLYLEAWQEVQHGWLAPLGVAAASAASGSDNGRPGSGASRAPGAPDGGDSTGLAAVERLLLDTYSQINEPDGIYAVARSHSMLSQLKRFEHEGDWSHALLAYDLALQHLAGAPGGSTAGATTQQQQQQPGRLDHSLGSQPASVGASQASAPGSHGAGAGPSFEGISRQAAVRGLLRSLSQMGAGHLLQAYAQAPGVADVAEQAALGLGQWGQLGGLGGGAAGGGFSADSALPAALAGLVAGSMERCRAAVCGARRGLVAGLVTASLEGAAHVNPALVQLQMLQAVSEAWEVLWPAMPDLGSVASPRRMRRGAPGGGAAAGPNGGALLEGVLQLWRAREAAAGAGGRYNLQAPLQGMHLQLLSSLGDQPKQAESLVLAAVAARKTDHFAQATTSLYKLRGMLQREEEERQGGMPAWVAAACAPDARWRVEEAKLLWAQGQHDTAVQLARSLLAAGAVDHRQRQGDRAMQRAYLQSLAAKWLSRTRSDSPTTVLSLMQEAVDQALGVGQASTERQRATACRVMYRLAHYADGLYRNIEAQKASPEYKTGKAVIEAKRRQLEQWAATLEARRRRGEAKVDKRGQYVDRESRMLLYHITTTTRPVEMDEAEQKLLDEKERQFLRTALHNYTRCLCTGDGYDLRVVFRIVQLWLRLGGDPEVNAAVGTAFREAPSFKFLPLVYQVASRLSAAKSGPLVESGFQSNLSALLVRLGSEHPHHSLYQVLSLKNGNRGRDGRVASGAAIEAFSYAADPDKVAAAHEVLARVAAHSPAAAAIVREMGELADAYIELAATPPPTKEAEEMAFPSALRRSRQHCTHVPVTSASLPVDPAGRYDSFPHFVCFGERIKFVGGINKPKIVTVTDSHGAQCRQLVKSGNDDLRQDAVMQQFFWLVNQFLAEQPRTQRRSLFIRTYKVVPFSPCSGLLEWVEHTLPLADYLLGPGRTAGAHARHHRSGDLTWYDAYQKLAKATQSRVGPEQLRAAFDEVCARFPPAMHHFFLENFRDPGTWFERRLAYTRSMAVNSMAGHIIGLGDRHLQNILLDTRTADAVHIDLGIAFEQVLRASKESILTVIEVFIHDPLYKWALTTTAAARRQHDAQPEEEVEGGGGVSGAVGGDGAISLANADAERTMLRVKQKLEGVEAGEGEARGVEGQVQQLLQDAQDHDKLSRMYVGWQAWC